ncbi:recombinase family protein [Flavobacteriaceae bacterium]|nr:recombinase family protein [Flavobacteriaceae bacterium]
MSKKLVIRYVRVSTFDQTTDKYIKEDDEKNGIHVIEEKISGYKVPLFEREKGILIKQMVLEGRVKEIICYSVDRISRSVKDLTEIISFLHENNVCLVIENLGVRSLVEKDVDGVVEYVETPTINFLIYLQGCFAELNYWERREKQSLGIKRAKEMGVYKQNDKVRGKEKMEKWINKPKIQKTIKVLRENPNMKNCDVAKLCDLHYHSVRKVRKVVGIEKMEKKKVEEWKKNQVFNKIGSSEFVDLMEGFKSD